MGGLTLNRSTVKGGAKADKLEEADEDADADAADDDDGEGPPPTQDPKPIILPKHKVTMNQPTVKEEDQRIDPLSSPL